jgi:DNA-directed RNA polymerase specialized sigma24 family protein
MSLFVLSTILGPLHGVARRLTKKEADAEDLVAESITRAWRGRASLTDTLTDSAPEGIQCLKRTIWTVSER